MTDASSWIAHPRSARLVEGMLVAACERSPRLQTLDQRLRHDTATHLGDWVDYLAVTPHVASETRWQELGFTPTADSELTVYRHAGGRFPALIADPRHRSADGITVGIKVDDAAVCDEALGDGNSPDAPWGASLRQIELFSDHGCALIAVERHGWAGMHLTHAPTAEAVALHVDAFRRRRRRFQDPAEGFAELERLASAAIAELGRDHACDRFFATERNYWQSRCWAGAVQKARQDRFGLGWANHDHHTYRSSRRWFPSLIAALERFGFRCRERFYAGAEAGWGAQVLEHNASGIVIFADVDLAPDEVAGDFAHQHLPHRNQLGTVGLWCALHGEAILEAGLHHLECTFLHDLLTSQLAALGVGMMKPFTDLPHLKQAFTVGERWSVHEHRIAHLLLSDAITADQAAHFRRDGAIGSHLENLERHDGFKGFNQHGVSHIIAGTDPRRQP